MVASFDLSEASANVIGTGAKVPFAFGIGKSVRSVTTANGLDKILDSIKTILQTRPGERFMVPDFGCLTGDTPIPLLDGTVVLMRDLVGREVWVYGNDGNYVVPVKTDGAVSRGFKQVVRVLLDDGAEQLCTPDHLFLLRDGTYRRADALSSGDSLMPLYRQINRRGYEETYIPCIEKWVPTHRLLIPKVMKGKVVHHADFNKRNNAPENLVVIGKIKHFELHSVHARETGILHALWSSREGRERMLNVVRRTIQRHNTRYKEDCAYREDIRVKRAIKLRAFHARRRLENTAARVEKERWKEQVRQEKLKRAHLIRSENARQFGVPRLIAWSRSEAGRTNARQLGKNKLKSVTRQGILEFATPLTFDGNRAELVTYVCQHFQLSRAALKRRVALSELAPQVAKGNKWHNHKVVSVEPLALELEVFDLVNTRTQNFAVGAGVFVHNSRLYDLVFEPNDNITTALLNFYTVEALKKWEKRVRITRVTFQMNENDPHYVGISIEFYVLQTHQKGSYVFPFVRQPAPMTELATGSESRRIFTQGQVLPL